MPQNSPAVQYWCHSCYCCWCVQCVLLSSSVCVPPYEMGTCLENGKCTCCPGWIGDECETPGTYGAFGLGLISLIIDVHTFFRLH